MGIDLTIGMACYDDSDGVFFTIQSLRRMSVGKLKNCELVVVDNNPNSPHGEVVRNLIRNVKDGGDFSQVTYESYTEQIGTSAPRDRVFRIASGKYVLCVDSHVVLHPDTVENLLAYYRKDPQTVDIISSPMLYDNLTSGPTHMEDLWRDEMWGVWACAWMHPSGRIFAMKHAVNEEAIPVEVMSPHVPISGMLPTKMFWSGHERALTSLGCMNLAATNETMVFEIPAMGLGFFSMKKDAWPGFNPKFRHFGGEEYYIHEKVRQHGGRALCITGIPWNHKFGRANGVPYPLKALSKIRNYIIGHTELGLSLERVYEHFVLHRKRITKSQWDVLVSGGVIEDSAVMPRPVNGPAEARQQWSGRMVNKAKPSPDAGQFVVDEKDPGCGGCSGGKVSPETTLEDLYKIACAKKSDINEHLPKLRELASNTRRFTEFGKRQRESTLAILAGQPEQFITYDVKRDSITDELEKRKGDCDFRFIQGSSLEVEIEETDTLFIDTKHTADHLWKELTRHANKVQERIVLHDTEIFGERGEDGGPGLLPAMRRFCREFPEWSVVYHAMNNNGLTVLSKVTSDKPSAPGMPSKIWNFGMAIGKFLASGLKVLPHDEVEKRLDACSICELRVDDVCTKCGCNLVNGAAGAPGRALMASMDCPLAKWPELTKKP